MTICRGCKSEIDEKEFFCSLCNERIQRDLGEAKGYLGQYDFKKALDKLGQVLAVDKENAVARTLKEEIESKLKAIQENKIQVDRCFKKGLYKEAIFYLEEILKIMPLDENLRLQKQMSEVLSFAESQHSIHEPRRRSRLPDWAKANHYMHSGWLLLVMALIVISIMGFFGDLVYRNHVKKTNAQDLYQILRQKIANREYYGNGFMDDYSRLIKDYSKTKYARKIKEEFLDASRQIIQGYIDKGNEYFNQGRYREALETYSKILEIEPFSREAFSLIQEAKEKITLKKLPSFRPKIRLDQARSSRTTAEDKPVSPQETPLAETDAAKRHILKGQIYFEEARYNDAIDEWNKAKDLMPPEDNAKIQAFIDKAEEFSLRKEENYNALIKQGHKFMEAEDWEEALPVFKTALKIKQNDPDVLQKINIIKSRLTPAKTSDVIIKKAPSVNVEEKNFIFKIIESLKEKYQQKKQHRARSYYNRALEEEKRGRLLKANYYYDKSSQYKFNPLIIKQIKINRMIEALRRQEALYPKDPIVKISLGNLYYAKGWLDKAESIWDSILFAHPDASSLDPLILGLKAKIYEKRGQFIEAKSRYEESLDKAEIFYIRNSLAKMLYEEGFYDEAIGCWRKILESNPFQLDVINSLAEAYIIFGRFEEARLLLKPIPQLSPFELRKRQIYPLEVDPEYFVGIVQEKDYFSRNTFLLSQFYSSLGDIAEEIHWNIISVQIQGQ
ncbi:MAG: tetratricopeptide repeat protein [Candidatus Omnitrophica bacterium]|nr:tetratricopeptide repeat protein [Candidatus Omnitrophota bacterium]MBU1933113.1 tetratricopeptide repeat protein [Candidatus Omnitrophota bacterium]